MKKILIYVFILGVLLGCGYFAYGSYSRGRQARLVKQARNYLDKNNQRKALLTLHRVLNYNSNDVEACRLMARLGEMNRSPSALFWRGRVVELNPRSLDDRLALAGAALGFGDYASAMHALEGVDEPGRRTAAYHNAAGAAAAKAHVPAQAEAHFLEAVRLEPQNAAAQLNLAVVRLQGTNLAGRAEGYATLEKLASTSTNSFICGQALRELLVDARRSNQMDKALALSNRLLQGANPVFHDRILRLEVLQQSRNKEFYPALAGFQREVAGNSNSGDIYELATWLMAHTLPSETLSWLNTLPLGVQTNQPVALVVAEAETTAKDWARLASLMAGQQWGELEFLRHAFQVRALRGLNSSGAAKGEWELALRAANGDSQSLAMLLSLTRQWDWRSESEELLWMIVKQDPGASWAVLELTRALYASGRTRSMLILCSQQVKRAPGRLELKRNLALLALLLDAEDLKPHELAREIYEKGSTNAACAATYAFSLLLQDKKAEAVAVIQKLTPKEAETPAVAGYYGLVLRANGENAKARTYLDLALKRPTLPEEQKLFQKARMGL